MNGVPVHYQCVGEAHNGERHEGEPIVLVHGLSASTLWWIRNVRSLAEHHCVYLVDLPGFGAMRHARSQFALAQAGSWLVSWMQAIGLERAHLIGHSMGGYICIWIAAHHPERVARLVLVSPSVMPHVQSVLGYMIPLLTSMRYLSLRFAPILFYDALRTGPMMLIRATNDILRGDVREEIHEINVPTLLVWGENDTLVPPSVGHILRHEFKEARLLMLHHAAHVSMFDQPQQFNEAVNAFLNGETVGK